MKIEGFSKYDLRRRPDGGWEVIGPRRTLSAYVNESGHPVVGLSGDDGRNHSCQIGRLVLLAHVGAPPTPAHECCLRWKSVTLPR